MTQQGVLELYEYLGAAWPLVIKPGIDETWKRNKLRELFRTYRSYKDEEVMEAFQKWTEEHEKFPTTKNIINEIQWARRMKNTEGKENAELWPMDFIKDDGSEWSYGFFKRSDFVNHKMNPDHLQPEEWERRFKIRRKQVLDRLYPLSDDPQAKYYARKFMEQIRHAQSM